MEYVKGRYGLLKHLESECACHLDAREVDRRLKTGQVALFLDGLDEIFDIATRASVIDEIIALASRYTRAPVVVTSRVIGYESEKLQIAGFTHATLEDFDDAEVREFKQRWRANGMAKLLKRMVARDGIEPPTPAFSVCDYPSRSTTCGPRTAAYVLPSTWKSGLLWVALWVEFSES